MTGAAAGAKTYYFDDVAFGGTTPPPATWSPITFDSSAVTYTLTGFGGAEDSTVVVDPTDAANKVAKVVKSATAELWAGTTVSTGANFSVPALPFTASSTTMTVRVWSPDAGIQVRLKVEDAADPTKSVETEATTTVANAWETLTFDFANQAAGHRGAEPGLHLQQGLDLLQLRRDRRHGGREDLLLRRRGVRRRHAASAGHLEHHHLRLERGHLHPDGLRRRGGLDRRGGSDGCRQQGRQGREVGDGRAVGRDHGVHRPELLGPGAAVHGQQHQDDGAGLVA